MALSGRPNQSIPYHYDDNGKQATVEKDEDYLSKTASMKLNHRTADGLTLTWSLFADEYEAEGYPSSQAYYDTGQDSLVLMSQLKAQQSLPNDRSVEIKAYYRDDDIMRNLILPPGSETSHFVANIEELRAGITAIFRQQMGTKRNTQWAIATSYEEEVLYNGSLTTVLADGSQTTSKTGDDGVTRYVSSLFFDATTRFNSKWSAQYSARLDNYSDFGNQLSPHAALIYRVSDETTLKTICGHAFRAPTSAELYSTAFNNSGNVDLLPEKIDSCEMAILRHSAQWRTSFVLFSNRWRNGISLIHDTSGAGTYQNTGKNESQGAEITAQYFANQWQIDFSGSYVDSKNSLTQSDYEQFPSVILNFGLGILSAPFDSEIYLNNRVFFGTKDTPASDTTDPEKLATYWRTDLNIVKPVSDHLSLFANILNLFDRDNILPSVHSLDGGIPDTPFSISAGARMTF